MRPILDSGQMRSNLQELIKGNTNFVCVGEGRRGAARRGEERREGREKRGRRKRRRKETGEGRGWMRKGFFYLFSCLKPLACTSPPSFPFLPLSHLAREAIYLLTIAWTVGKVTWKSHCCRARSTAPEEEREVGEMRGEGGRRREESGKGRETEERESKRRRVRGTQPESVNIRASR